MENSRSEKEITFNRLRNDASNSIFKAIQNCNDINRSLNMPIEKIPDITTAYNNKIIELEKEFTKVGIDFYDREKCETRFIIENRLQASILLGTTALENYLSHLSVTPQQIEDFIKSYKKPSAFSKIIIGAKYKPKTSILTDKQKRKSRISLRQYLNHCNEIYNYTISDNIVESILFYKTLANKLGTQGFDDRIETIDTELQKLGYQSIKDIVHNEISNQDLSMQNIGNLKSVKIEKRDKEMEK